VNLRRGREGERKKGEFKTGRRDREKCEVGRKGRGEPGERGREGR
jgi:hypothetical protein